MRVNNYGRRSRPNSGRPTVLRTECFWRYRSCFEVKKKIIKTVWTANSRRRHTRSTFISRVPRLEEVLLKFSASILIERWYFRRTRYPFSNTLTGSSEQRNRIPTSKYVLHFRITNTFFSTTLGTNKHVVNRFLYPFCVPGKGFFFVDTGGNALPHMQIADASYPSVNPSENT